MIQSPAKSKNNYQLTVELESYLGEMLFEKLRLIEENHETVAQAVHDLRGPITNIKLYLYLLERSKPEEQAKYISVLKECVNELTEMTGDLMEHMHPDKPVTKKLPETPLH